jgi:DNA-binding NarL/FixJ family response regulator
MKESKYRERVEYLRRAVQPLSLAPRLLGGETVSTRPPHNKRLTDRQRQIARRVVSGWTNPQIADELGISRRTVGNHVAAILNRLDVRSRWQLTREGTEQT